MKWLIITLIATVALLPSVFAEEEHGHHHEPKHWQNTAVRHELLTQLGAIGTAGAIAGGYLLIRRRVHP